MAYILVTAEFPHVTANQRDTIYTGLLKRNWMKVTDPGGGIDTVWYRYFEDTIDPTTAMERSRNDFVTCSRLYCKIKMAMHWGPHKPQFKGMVYE